MKKRFFARLAISALCMLTLAGCLISCAGYRVSDESAWNNAFDPENFDNFTIKATTRYTGPLTESDPNLNIRIEYTAQFDGDRIYSTVKTGINTDTLSPEQIIALEMVLGPLEDTFTETYYEKSKKEDGTAICYLYQKAKDTWYRSEISEEEYGRVREQLFVSDDVLSSFRYDHFQYDEKSESYIYSADTPLLTVKNVRISDNKLLSIESRAGTMEFSRYGRTRVFLPCVK